MDGLVIENPPPAVGQVWRGVEHGSLFRVLLVREGKVTFQVMHLGNDQLAEALPAGKIRTVPAETWDNGMLEYAWLIDPVPTPDARRGTR